MRIAVDILLSLTLLVAALVLGRRSRTEAHAAIEASEKRVLRWLVALTSVGGVAAVVLLRVLWLDFFLVALSLVLRPMIGRRLQHVVRKSALAAQVVDGHLTPRLLPARPDCRTTSRALVPRAPTYCRAKPTTRIVDGAFDRARQGKSRDRFEPSALAELRRAADQGATRPVRQPGKSADCVSAPCRLPIAPISSLG